MEGGVAATIEVLVQNLINVAGNEFSLIRSLDKEAQKLQTSLSMIKSYMNDANNKFITQEETVKIWLKELEAVAFDADDVLDELNYHLLSKKVKKLMSLKHKVLFFFSSSTHITRPSKMAHRIQEINITLETISKRATELGLQSMVVNASAPNSAFETDSFTVDPIFIGRDDDVPLLVEKMTDRAEERKFSVLAIVGMGGMGKTTLTRKVINHDKIKTQFGSLVWVHVSQTFDPIIIFKKILASLASKSDEAESKEHILEKAQKSFKDKTDEVESREVILKKLQEALKARTCLVILDDVWNQDLQKWEEFMNSLSGVTSMKGNGIIVTTRNTEVASIVNPLYIHTLTGLSDEECWSIIKAKCFENAEYVSSAFESIGRKIAKRCQGLPLAANVVGGVLRSKSEEEWLSVQENWLPDVEGDNSISKILRLSFDNLSSPSLKKCFTYCSIFPKGGKIGKQELIELWMAEGFLQADGRNDMESVGNKFLNVLLHSSLLLVAPRDGDYGDVESCVMHDLVQDLACSVLGCSKVRYYRRHKASRIPKEEAKYLRTLLFEGDISGTMFSDFKCLHALTLTNLEINELPNSIRQLIHLRSLNISETRIKYLPEWIGELHHLQTLRANTAFYLVTKLPSTLRYLISLRHLYINYGVELPAEIGRLTSLRTLTHFAVGQEKGYKIEELGSLNYLKGRLWIVNLEKVHDKNEAMKANISQKPNLIDLVFRWHGSREGNEINDESVLEGLQPHTNLKKLRIERFKGKRFPLWTLKMAVRDEPQGCWITLNKLTEISLSSCTECEEVPALGHLPNLKSLTLFEFSNVECIDSSFYAIDNNNTGAGGCINVFPVLERLTMNFMPKLREWAEVETGPNCEEVKLFPHLQYLTIKNCEELMSAPTHFPLSLKELHISTVDSPIPMANIFEIKFTSLTDLWIRGIDGLECLPDWLFYNNPKLSTVRVGKCPKLRELPDGLHTLSSLEELTIEDCPNLKWIGQSQGSLQLTSLRSLKILYCLDLMDGFPYEMASLQTLSLVVLDSQMKPRSKARSEILTVDAILNACSHSLTDLKLRGMKSWECLPESIQNLTALSELELEDLGIEELPEWFGNLSSLKVVTISYCMKLRRLPSVDAMQRLVNLQTLYISGCPELCIDSKKYPKISNFSIYDDDCPRTQPPTRKCW